MRNFFNKSYETGEVPDEWRQDNVVLIYKKVDKSEPENIPTVRTLFILSNTDSGRTGPVSSSMETFKLRGKTQPVIPAVPAAADIPSVPFEQFQTEASPKRSFCP